MRCVVKRADLVSALKVLRFVCRGGDKNIRQLIELCQLKVTKGGGLSLGGVNLTQGLLIALDAEVKKAGGIAVPAELLFRTVSSAEQDSVTLSLTPKTRRLSVTCGRVRSSMTTTSIEECPQLDREIAGELVTFSAGVLLDSLSKVIQTIGTDEARQALTSVLVRVRDDQLEIVSTDGHRLTRVLSPYHYTGERLVDGGVLLPGSSVVLLVRLLAGLDSDAVVELTLDTDWAFFELGDCSLSSVLGQGRFPNFSRAIPEHSETSALFKVQVLKDAVGRAMLYTSEARKIVVDLARAGVEVRAQGHGIGEVRSEIDSEAFRGDDIAIAFNGLYVNGCLSALEGDEVELRAVTANSPVLWVDTARLDVTRLIMPMEG